MNPREWIEANPTLSLDECVDGCTERFPWLVVPDGGPTTAPFTRSNLRCEIARFRKFLHNRKHGILEASDRDKVGARAKAEGGKG